MAEPAARAAIRSVFFDAIRVKIRDEGLVRNKAVYLWRLVLQQMERRTFSGSGSKTTEAAVPGQGDERSEGPRVEDILIAVVDGQ